MSEFAEVEAQLQRVNQFGPNFDAALRAASKQRQNKDRSFIVYAVVGLYTFAVTVSIIYLIIYGLYAGKEIFPSLAEIIKVAILPILTLVIGYYFGTKSE